MVFWDVINDVVGIASGAFIDVTVFVGAALLIFGAINYKMEGRLVEYITNKKVCQPLVGALLGLIPGCGGAILVMPLYVRRNVSFGTVVAALIATAGDSAFVLISKDIKSFIFLSLISFVVAVVSGCLVDRFGIGKKYLANTKKLNIDIESKCVGCKKDFQVKHLGHEEGDEIDKILHCKAKHHQHKNTLGYKITHRGYLFYWIFLGIGLVFGISNIFQVGLANDLWLKVVLYFGLLGTLISIVLMLAGKKYFSDDTHEEVELKLMSFKETLIHNAEETAFVGVWVFVAYLAFGFFTSFVGEESLMLFTGLGAVLLASFLGIIPGCGVQIIFASLYVKGLFPFAALLAHGISQDGDALFPLLAMDKKASFVATVITTIIALLVGGAWYFLF